MKPERPLVDSRSFELAEHFLPAEATEDEKWSLADTIQKAVEGWFEWQEHLAEARKGFKVRLEGVALVGDAVDFDIMVWAQRHPRVCASNAPTGEHIIYGGRRQEYTA